MAGQREPGPSADGGLSNSGRDTGDAGSPSASQSRSPGDGIQALSIPEMSDLYRRLLHDLTARFGVTLDETNADAIAYAAAELYHRDFEPRLWQEKSAHDLLDLFGVPRAGVFAPYSLSDRLLLFERRSSQAQYVSRAHEVLTAMGVPRHDEDGVEQSLKWRLDKVLESVGDEDGEVDENGDPDEQAGDGDEARSQEGEDAAGKDAPGKDDGKDDGDAEDAAGKDDGVAAVESGPRGTDEPADGDGVAGGSREDGSAEDAVAVLAEAGPDLPATRVIGTEPSPAQLTEAMRALEQAAEVEAQLNGPGGPNGPGGVDLVSLTETLSKIQGEIAALRDLVEAFEIGMRRQLDELLALLAENRSAPVAAPEPPALIPQAVDPTHEMPPLVVEEEPGRAPEEADGEGQKPRRRGWRGLVLVLLLVLLGVGIAAGVAVGWDAIRAGTLGALGLLP